MDPASKQSTIAFGRREATGLVLAGGAGRRVQGRDKGLIDWQGQPLVAHAATTLRPLVSELLISCNRHSDRYVSLADRVMPDHRPGYQGPLAGLEAAMGLVATPLLLVAPCDMPGIPGAVFVRLLEALSAPLGQYRDAVYLRSSRRNYYLCLALRTGALAGLAEHLDSGRKSVRGWLATLNAKPLSMDLPSDQLQNMNEVSAQL